MPEGAAVIEWPVLRAANRACNEETRRRHRADTDLHTGTSISRYRVTKWFLATRGMKLRTLEAQRRLYIGERAIATRRKEEAMRDVKDAGRVGDGAKRPKEQLAGDFWMLLLILPFISQFSLS